MPRYARRPSSAGSGRSGCLGKGRLLIALVIAVVSIISYLSTREYNPVTDEVQYVDLSPEQEVALGLQAAPQLAQQHGGLYPDEQVRRFVTQVGERIVARSDASDTPYEFDFHLLADEQTLNAFALPGGQIFVTAAMMNALETEGELAGVLAHEIGHVVARHGAEHMAKQKLTQGLTGAAVIAAYDPENPRGSQASAAVAAMIGQLVNMRYGRGDEIESDVLGVRFAADAGYDPRSMIRVMEVLRDASGGNRPAEFFSTHPNPDNRIERIQQAIDETYPNGVPDGLKR